MSLKTVVPVVLASFENAAMDLTMIATADFGNGYELVYGVTSAGGKYAPFTWRSGTDEVVWHGLTDVDPGIAAINAVDLIGKIASGEIRDPHEVTP